MKNKTRAPKLLISYFPPLNLSNNHFKQTHKLLKKLCVLPLSLSMCFNIQLLTFWKYKTDVRKRHLYNFFCLTPSCTCTKADLSCIKVCALKQLLIKKTFLTQLCNRLSIKHFQRDQEHMSACNCARAAQLKNITSFVQFIRYLEYEQ